MASFLDRGALYLVISGSVVVDSFAARDEAELSAKRHTDQLSMDTAVVGVLAEFTRPGAPSPTAFTVRKEAV